MNSSKEPYLFSVKRFLLLLAGLFVHLTYSVAQIIDMQPQDAFICEWENSATFEVRVNPAYQNMEKSYQWYKIIEPDTIGEMIIINSTGSRYQAETAGKYYCEVTVKDHGTEKSQNATLTFKNFPVISDIDLPAVCNKSSLTVTAGSINVRGDAISSYSWKIDNVEIAGGAVTDSIIPPLSIPLIDSTRNGLPLMLTVTNGCGPGTSVKIITIYPTPSAPTVVSKDYCQGDEAEPLSIVQDDNLATWYTQKNGGTGTVTAPIPDTEIFTPQKWWVSQTIVYDANTSCEGYRSEVTVLVHRKSALPVVPQTNISLCLNDPDIRLEATGDSIKWYDAPDGQPSSVAPQINTTEAGVKKYYVTQTEPGKCESPKLEITVTIKDKANENLINVSGIPDISCPYEQLTMEVTVDNSISNPVFTWYSNDNKTGLLQQGNSLTTPVLTTHTTYYVTLEYEGYCESISPKAIYVRIEDRVRPTITAPPDIVVSTDDGICTASEANVLTVRPEVRDNCTSEDDLIISLDSARVDYLLGSTTIIWWVEDRAGNRQKAAQTVTIKDMEFPKTTCPEDIEIIVNDGVSSAVVDYEVDFTDNCNVLHITREAGPPSGSVFPLGETIVKHSARDTAGNETICEFKVIVRRPDRPLNVALRVSSYEICSGQSVTLSPVVTGGTGKYSYTWAPRRWTNAVLEDYPLVTTSYELTVDDGKTRETKNVNITVLRTEPVALQYDGRVDEILEGSEVMVRATDGFSSYKFLLNNEIVQEVGQNSKIAFMAQLGLYTIRVFATDENYCVAQSQLEIDVESKKLPNVFTPNQDGKNEIFLEGYDLMVFSRSGELIYKGLEGWDGRYKGKMLPQGTYLYVVRRTMINGEHREYKGTVTLKQ
jgi:gliding motility-associated-like protein